MYGYLLLAARKTEKAHALFRGMRVLLPGDVHVAKCLAMTALATGDAKGAVAIAEQLRGTAQGDDAVVLDVVCGKALYALGRVDEARRLLETALSSRTKRLNGAGP
jgi:Flp pilus assembly protein TadD